MLSELMNPLKALKAKAQSGVSVDDLSAFLKKQTEGRQTAMESLQKAGALSVHDKRKNKSIIGFLTECERQLRNDNSENAQIAFDKVKERFDDKVAEYKQSTEKVKVKLHYLFRFVEDVFGSGNEMLILVTECTVQADCAKFISMYGCEDYKRHNEELMLTERGGDLMQQIEELEIGMGL